MSWSLTYRLPWPRLDIPAVEAAIRRVLTQLPDRPRESKLEVRAPGVANWYVAVYPDEERRWSLDIQAEVDRRFALYGIADGEALWVDILFTQDAGDPGLGIRPRTTFWLDSACSGNSLAPGAAAHVCELLGEYFGVEPDRD